MIVNNISTTNGGDKKMAKADVFARTGTLRGIGGRMPDEKTLLPATEAGVDIRDL
jgi:hypothetical protein